MIAAKLILSSVILAALFSSFLVGSEYGRFSVAKECAVSGYFYHLDHRFECEDFNEDD